MDPISRLVHSFRDLFHDRQRPGYGALEIFKYIGPGLLVTVGFIDPGNWAANVAAGAGYGYTLLWMVSLSTLMLILLQHNAAHLGIATGLCMSEAATKHLPKLWARLALGSAVLAAVATALAELLGGAIALRMLLGLPVQIGVFAVAGLVTWLLLSSSYLRIENYIIGLVSLIGLCFLVETVLSPPSWEQAAVGWVMPSFPNGSLPIIMSVLGAVVMPHNLFLHSEIIQSRQWNLEDESTIRRQLNYEFLDTLLSMGIGWAINSAMILLAASTFFVKGMAVTELEQAEELLRPLLGPAAAIIFAVGLLLAGISSSLTAGIAGASIFAGIFGEPYDVADNHSRAGLLLTIWLAAALVLLVPDPFQGLIVSQVLLSVQLPVTVLLLISLTSSPKVMGAHANDRLSVVLLSATAAVVIGLNVALLWDMLL